MKYIRFIYIYIYIKFSRNKLFDTKIIFTNTKICLLSNDKALNMFENKLSFLLDMLYTVTFLTLSISFEIKSFLMHVLLLSLFMPFQVLTNSKNSIRYYLHHNQFAIWSRMSINLLKWHMLIVNYCAFRLIQRGYTIS